MKIYPILALFVSFLLPFSALATLPAYPFLIEQTPFSGSQLFTPNDSLKHTSVIILHGSEGGSAGYLQGEASVLAAQGFHVLELCYFDCNRGFTGPRQTLRNVEANIVLDAVAWLRERPNANGQVVVYGFSRGAELTMIVGAMGGPKARRPDALIAHSPADVFTSYYSWSWSEPACWLCRRGQGFCPPGTPDSEFDWNLSCGEDPRFLDFSLSAWLVNGKPIPAGLRIEIERFAGPVLLTVGAKDKVWSPDQTKRIEATIRNSGGRVEAHYFPDSGHLFTGVEEVKRRELVLDFLYRL